ncbi:sugar transferase [Streptomyces sp. NPDC056437]|uniref:sugar transferase n=1 Tax=Streptomyces sp. NPDC056437 TaxID=3345816 RepID=UPI0036A35FC7
MMPVERLTPVGRVSAKRLMDVTGGLLLLLLLTPLMAVIAVAVALTSRRAALVRHRRIGLAGRPFGILAFRAAPGTRTGRLLRRHFLDELPQLLHVVRGEMSLVGPRPLRPEDADPAVGGLRTRLGVRPGLTGLWQVSGRSDMPWEEKAVLDLHYVEQHWLGLDLAIMVRTLPAALVGRRPRVPVRHA